MLHCLLTSCLPWLLCSAILPPFSLPFKLSLFYFFPPGVSLSSKDSSFLLQMALSISPSPSFTMSCFPAEEARELCCSAVSAVITKLFYAIFIFLFAVVGATLGALIGAFVGAKTKIGCLHGATIGAIKGTFFSIKLFTISLIVYSSDDMATTCLQQPINAFVSTLNKAPWNKRLSEDSTETIPKIRITEENVWDSSRNRISCSICLQDFLQGEIVHSWPHCYHKFHVSCIQKWLMGHQSCPLCRRNLGRSKTEN